MNENDENKDLMEINQTEQGADTYVSREPLKWYQRLVALFFSPTKLFRDFEFSARFGYVIVFAVLLSIGATAVSMLSQSVIMQEQYRLVAKYIDPDYAVMLEQAGNMQGNSVATTIGTVIGFGIQIAMIFFLCLVNAGIAKLVSGIFKANIPFKKMYSLFIHCYIFALIGGILTSLMYFILNSPVDVFSLSVLAPTGDISMLWFRVLSAVTLFSIWSGIVVAIGVATLADLDKNKAIVAGIVVAIVNFIVAVGISAVSDPLQMYRFTYGLMQQ